MRDDELLSLAWDEYPVSIPETCSSRYSAAYHLLGEMLTRSSIYITQPETLDRGTMLYDTARARLTEAVRLGLMPPFSQEFIAQLDDQIQPLLREKKLQAASDMVEMAKLTLMSMGQLFLADCIRKTREVE